MTSHLQPIVDGAHGSADRLARAVAAVGLELEADRCWLYARNPHRGAGIALVRWLRTAGTTDVPVDVRRWAPEAPDLAERDPLFSRALAGESIDVVEDAATGPVTHELERALGHRAFMHLNLHAGAVLWGTLQPGMTRTPRCWSAQEQELLLRLRPALAGALAGLIYQHGDRLRSRLLVGAGASALS